MAKTTKFQFPDRWCSPTVCSVVVSSTSSLLVSAAPRVAAGSSVASLEGPYFSRISGERKSFTKLMLIFQSSSWNCSFLMYIMIMVIHSIGWTKWTRHSRHSCHFNPLTLNSRYLNSFYCNFNTLFHILGCLLVVNWLAVTSCVYHGWIT